MGSSNSRQHPRNFDLQKFKKKFDTESLRNLHLKHIWIIGADKQKSQDLAEKIGENLGYLVLSETEILKDEARHETERSRIIREILADNKTVCPNIVLDVLVETLLRRLPGAPGVILQGIPRDLEQSWHLQRLVGRVAVIVYCELSEFSVLSSLREDTDTNVTVRNRANQFHRFVNYLSKHNDTIKVDGEKLMDTQLDDCLIQLNSMDKLKHSKYRLFM